MAEHENPASSEEALERDDEETAQTPEAPETPEAAAADMEETESESGSEMEAPETEEKEDEQTALLREIETMKETHLRLRAEYDNYRKRTIREKSDLLKYAAEKVIVDFLEVLDDFDRALENIPDEEPGAAEAKKGISLIHDKMISKLRSQGAKEMEVIGKPFDAEQHDAIAMVPVEEPERKGTVIDCVQKGYTLLDKVIRHPKVVVGQ